MAETDEWAEADGNRMGQVKKKSRDVTYKNENCNCEAVIWSFKWVLVRLENEETKEEEERNTKLIQRKKEKMKSKEHIKISLFAVIQQIPIFPKLNIRGICHLLRYNLLPHPFLKKKKKKSSKMVRD